MNTFESMITDLIDDKQIDENTKVEMLNDWKQRLLAKNENRLMSKEEAEKYFKWLGKIDGAIAALVH